MPLTGYQQGDFGMVVINAIKAKPHKEMYGGFCRGAWTGDFLCSRGGSEALCLVMLTRMVGRDGGLSEWMGECAPIGWFGYELGWKDGC